MRSGTTTRRTIQSLEGRAATSPWTPIRGGYAGRDPKTDMPSVPDDERESGGVDPPSGGDRPAHD